MAKDPKTIERTAKTAFKLSGTDVGAGQIVTLTQQQLKSLAASGCVELDDDANAEVPVRNLPATQGSIAPAALIVIDYAALSDDELKAIAVDRNVDTKAVKSRNDMIAALQLDADGAK